MKLMTFKGAKLSLSTIGFACCLFWAASPALAAIPRIINGVPVSTRNSSVVETRITISKSSGFICTGSVLAPNVILTASHCASKTPKNMSVRINGRTFPVKSIRIHPNARSTNSGLIYNDVALLFLSKPTSKKPVSILVSRAPKVNDTITIMGYGLDELGHVGTLRQGTATISRVLTDFVVTTFTSKQQSNTCNGDSGGPAIYSYTDSLGANHTGIIGTTSTGTSQTCSLGDNTFYVNLQSPTVRNFLVSKVHSLKLA